VGGFVLTDARIARALPGYGFAFANCALFMIYLLLGHISHCCCSCYPPVYLLPASAASLGVLVLRQTPTAAEMLGIALVIGGFALHRRTGDQTRLPVRLVLCDVLDWI
jgi:threonine/homoserine efflux transporter RhtA